MIATATLRDWAGVTDDSKEALLEQIRDGVIGLFARATHRVIVTPPQVYQQVLDVPAIYNGGLSYLETTQSQRIVLAEVPRAKRSGTVTVAADSKAVTGSGTSFTKELSVDPDSAIRIGAETHVVDAITDDTNLTLATAHEAGASGAAYSADLISIECRSGYSSAWVAEDPTDYELEGRTLVSGIRTLPAGERRLRVRYMLGYETGELPDDWELVILKVFRAVYTRRQRRTSSLSVDGAIRVSWADIGSEAKHLRDEVKQFARPMVRVQPGTFLAGGHTQWAA